MKKIKKDRVLYQITKYGFFAEMVPECFDSGAFAEIIPSICLEVKIDRETIKKTKKISTAPVEVSTYKNDISRRILSVPNPQAFLRLAKLLSKNWEEIVSITSSPNSLSPITVIRDYQDTEEIVNSENLREALHMKSDFIEGIKKCIRLALGYQYKLKVDIANCYNTIYTHSITWAICGKKEAKLYYKTKEPTDLKQRYELGDSIDTLVRCQKNNETNGIVVGPFTSRIVSEIVLSRIDTLLRNEGFLFKRYVDDYKFYFRTQVKAEDAIRVIERILNEYNLNLNLSKTEIKRFPFETISDLNESFKKAYKQDGVFGVLNQASVFHENGEKGAYKYALKYIKGKDVDTESLSLVFPLLINIMLIEPKYGKHVVRFAKEKKEYLDIKTITNIVNKELQYSLEHDLQQESLIYLDFIKQLDITISGNNLKKVIESGNDLAIIIGLDLWKNHNKRVDRTRKEASEIKKAIEVLGQELKSEEYRGNRWLLLYETDFHNLIPKDFYVPVKKDEFFKSLYENNVSFYLI